MSSIRKPEWKENRNNRTDSALEQLLKNSILHMDEEVLAIYKPPGIPVQGGTGSTKHIDGALDALRFGLDQRPRLVHRLDKIHQACFYWDEIDSRQAGLLVLFENKLLIKLIGG